MKWFLIFWLGPIVFLSGWYWLSYYDMLTILIDPDKLGTQASFAQEATAFVDWLRQSPPGAGFDHAIEQAAGKFTPAKWW